MNPKKAVERLQGRNWSCIQIAAAIGMHRSSIYRVLNDEQLLTYLAATKLIDLAKSGRKPPKQEKSV